MLILYHATSYPWKISLWSRYAPRHQFPNLLQGDVAEEEKIISNNNKHEHANQVQRNYEVDHYAYIVRGGNCRKLEEDILGPFRIKKVHNNRSIIIKIVIVNELINIRHITPHFEDPPTWALVFSHWGFRLIGLFCSPYMLSCIRFWILLDSPASIREEIANTIWIYRTFKGTFFYLPENSVNVSHHCYIYLIRSSFM